MEGMVTVMAKIVAIMNKDGDDDGKDGDGFREGWCRL